MIELQSVAVKLTSFNARAENHGDEKKPAADIKIEAILPNDVLSEFHPTLKSLLYHKDANAQPGDLVDQTRADEPGWLPNRRFPKLGPLKWDDETIGAAVSIAYGATGRSIDLSGCNINGWTLEPMEGGSVSVAFRIQAHPDEKQSGKLCMMVQQEVELTLTPPAAPGDMLNGERETADAES